MWWKTELAQVKCANGQIYEAWHVIVTVPIGVLARGDITFLSLSTILPPIHVCWKKQTTTGHIMGSEEGNTRQVPFI